MESYALEKSTNDEIFGMYFCGDFNSQNLQCKSISLKAFPIFLKNFFNIRLGMIEQQGIRNLSSYI